jgi:hypothetical protein
VKRLAAVLVGLCLLMPLGTGIASAGKPERYVSQSFNAYWNHRRKIDRTHYIQSQWYAGVYDSGEDFWSDLYKSVRLCTKGDDGRTRCRSKAFWYGDINDLGDGSFTIDSQLETGSLEATYRLESREGRDEELIGRTTISVQLTGVGDISKNSYRATYQEGCNTFRYTSRSEYRRAEATGSFSIKGGTEGSFGTTQDGYMSQGSSMDFSKTC